MTPAPAPIPVLHQHLLQLARETVMELVDFRPGCPRSDPGWQAFAQATVLLTLAKAADAASKQRRRPR
jgi:hypothetical protein